MTQKALPVTLCAVVLCGSLLWLCSCSGSQKVLAEPSSTTMQPVAVARVTRHDLSRDLELAAEFRPNQQIDVHAKVSGYVKAIYVDVGDRVAKGQLIAELEVPEMAQELAQTTSIVKRSELDVERARGEVSRSEATFKIRELSYNRLAAVRKAKPTLIAQQEIDDASARLSEAEAQLRAAKAALAVTEEQVQSAVAGNARVDTMISYLRISAPFSGVITRRFADTGAMIQAGTASQTQAMPVVSLSQVDHLRLVLPVPESVVSRIRIGAPVEVRVDSLNRIFQGKIARFTGKLNSSTRMMDTEVDIPNPSLALLPGMYGNVTLTLDRRMDTLAVPVQAVSRNTSTPSALIVNQERQLEERKLELGIETPHEIEVLAGLKENDLVVVGNRNQLKAGMRVEPRPVSTSGLKENH